MLDETATRFGAVETPEEGRAYARFLDDNRGKFGGVILCLPNFGDENGAVAALKLYGPRRLTIAGWMDQATTLYANLSVDQRFSASLTRYGYSAAKLDMEQALVEDLRLGIQAQVQKTGGAQSTTAARDVKLRELDT